MSRITHSTLLPLTLCLLLLHDITLAQEKSVDVSKSNIENLISKLRSDEDEVRYDAALALAKLRKDALPYLMEGLIKEQGYARVYVARIIIETDIDSQPALETLVEIAKDKKERKEIRRYSSYALALAPSGAKMLVEMLNDGDLFVRRSAAFALEELIEIRHRLAMNYLLLLKSSIPKLLLATNDSDSIVKGVAIEALMQLTEEMKDVIAHTDNDELKKAAVRVLNTQKKSEYEAGVGHDLQLKPGYEDALIKSGNFLSGPLGIIRAIAMRAGVVKDYRSIPGKLGQLSLHVVINPKTDKAWSGVNRYNPYMDLK